MSMGMIKRLQIPSNDQDEKLFKNAARREKLPTAEWARRILRREALRAKSGFTWDELFQELHSDTGVDLEAPARPKSDRPVPTLDLETE